MKGWRMWQPNQVVDEYEDLTSKHKDDECGDLARLLMSMAT